MGLWKVPTGAMPGKGGDLYMTVDAGLMASVTRMVDLWSSLVDVGPLGTGTV